MTKRYNTDIKKNHYSQSIHMRLYVNEEPNTYQGLAKHTTSVYTNLRKSRRNMIAQYHFTRLRRAICPRAAAGQCLPVKQVTGKHLL